MPQMTDNPKLGARFQAALAYAFELHIKQERKGTDIPYMSHLMAVAAIVLEHGGNEDDAIAALLHDAVEDQGGLPTLNEIRARFGSEVAGMVGALSDSLVDTDAEEKAPWRERKEAYLEHLLDASPRVRRIVAADKLHNCRAKLADLRRIGESVWARFNAPREDQIWFYREIHARLAALGRDTLVDEFGDAVAELEAVARRGGPGIEGDRR